MTFHPPRPTMSAGGNADANIVDALEESEERYRFLTDTIPVQIWTALPDGSLDYVSHQTAYSLGLTAEQLLADGWQSIVHADDLPRAVERWMRALETGGTYEVEFRLKTRGGDYAWHLARAVPQRNAAGAIVRWFGTNTNIEDQRAHQRQVETQAAQLREQNRLLALEAEVGSVLARDGVPTQTLHGCADAVVRHLDAAFARIWTADETGRLLELQASAGIYTHLDGPHGRVPVGHLKIGRIAARRKPHFTNQVVGDPEIGDQAWAIRERMVAFAGYPIVFGEKLVGVFAAFARVPFSDATIATLGSVANSLAQALERRHAEERTRLREIWLSTTLSSIGDGVIATDREGRILFLNPVAATLTGWTQDEAAGQKLDDVFLIVNEDTRAPVESPVAKVLREGTVVGVANHTILLRRNGIEVPIDDSAAPIHDRSGELTGVVLVFRDAGEKRRVEAERVLLLAQEQRAHREADAARAELHSLFMQAPAPICILRGPEHTFALANPAYMRLVGTRRTVVGLPVREALPELADQGFFELLDGVYQSGEPFVGNELAAKLDRGGDGHTEDAFFNFVYEPFRDLEGQVAGILAAAFDVTSSVQARQALQGMLDDRGRLLELAQDARRNAEVASRAKDDFLATASHELRTPLNAILGWARLLRSGNLEHSAFVRGLETIERNALAQVRLIEDILDGSRLVTGNLHLEIRPLDLTAVVNAALDAVRPSAAAKGIAIAVALEPAAAHSKGDPDRLQQVVWNLVNNAIKFTPKGGRIEIRLDRVGTSIDLSVKDSGQGIDNEFLPYIFERFRQADPSTTRRHGGLGLGLALVRHLVEAHGGTVRAESAGPGTGATFIVTLPVVAVFPGPTDVGPSNPTRTAGSVAVTPKNLQGIRVLVVDDEPDARDLVATVLRVRGADVVIATSVDHAIELVEQQAPTVLVSDVGMPVSDGYALLKRVRALDLIASQVPAIALTAYAREEDRRRTLEAGFQGYLTKPVEPDALVCLVSELARRGP